jgi:hypothetical protein
MRRRIHTYEKDTYIHTYIYTYIYTYLHTYYTIQFKRNRLTDAALCNNKQSKVHWMYVGSHVLMTVSVAVTVFVVKNLKRMLNM